MNASSPIDFLILIPLIREITRRFSLLDVLFVFNPHKVKGPGQQCLGPSGRAWLLLTLALESFSLYLKFAVVFST